MNFLIIFCLTLSSHFISFVTSWACNSLSLPFLSFLFFWCLSGNAFFSTNQLVLQKIKEEKKFPSALSFSIANQTQLPFTDEKNDPDIIPHDNSDDEKDFERLYTPTNLNYVNRHSPNSNSPTLRFSEKQVSGTWNNRNFNFLIFLLLIIDWLNSTANCPWPRIQALHCTTTQRFANIMSSHRQLVSTIPTQPQRQFYGQSPHPTFTLACRWKSIHLSH